MKKLPALLWAALLALCTTAALRAADPPAPAPAKPHYTYVIVHGATAGGWEWKAVGALLVAEGHTVYRPTLTGLGERGHLASSTVSLATHIDDVVNTILWEDLHDVILVGHSYGGMVITGVMDRVPDRIKHVIYLDAMVPDDGQSAYSLVGGPPPKSKVVDGLVYFPWFDAANQHVPRGLPQSEKTFSEPVSYKNPAAKTLPVTYVAFLANGQAKEERAAKDQNWHRAAARGWTIRTLPGPHVLHMTNPPSVATLLQEAVADQNQPADASPAPAAK